MTVTSRQQRVLVEQVCLYNVKARHEVLVAKSVPPNRERSVGLNIKKAGWVAFLIPPHAWANVPEGVPRLLIMPKQL